MYNATLHEFLSTRIWMMQREAFANYSRVLSHNFFTHAPSGELKYDKPAQNIVLSMTGSGSPKSEKLSSGQPLPQNEEDNDAQKVLVLDVRGPITRHGDYCTVSSVWHRDLLMSAAEDKNVAGVVFLIDTCGGTSFSLHDYRQGLDALKEKGKRSISFVDGACFSAGVALACQTDYITVFNRADEIGCIGSMIAGWTVKDGTVDANGYRFMDITASQTPDKNLSYNKAAEGDYNLMQEEVDACAKDFLDLIEEMRPSILPEQRTGKIYRAGEVMGSMVDGVATLEDCIQYVITGEIDLSIEMTPQESPESDDDEDGNDGNDGNDDNGDDTAGEEEEETEDKDQEEDDPQKENPPVSGGFASVASALGCGSLTADNKGGLYLQSAQAVELERRLKDMMALKDQKDTISSLRERIARAEKDKDAETSEKTKAQKEMEDTKALMDSMRQTITDLQEEVGRLNRGASPAPHIGASPANNGQSALQPALKVSGASYNPNLSPAQNAEKRKQAERKLERMAYGK